jgi:hypothetical protein
MNCSNIPTSVRRTHRSSTVATESETFGDLEMKMYILALATLLAAAGSASANNDYIGCDKRGFNQHSDEYLSKFCGDSSRYESRDENRGQSYGGSSSSGNGNSYN